MFPLHLLPPNGFDTSILTPVLVGMAFLAFFSETFGWPFVGLVVPGYLAAVTIAAPASGVTIILEAFVTYFLSRAVGIWMPETGSWTVFFGRERFFLLILSSVIVRLFTEGIVMPYLASRFGYGNPSELYSIGLVLVPLVANAFWNIGFVRGVFQGTIIVGLTILATKVVVMPLTNLSLSRFELTYESVALDFLASAKAYIVLIAGTMLAARSNVRFGWDFNGILVPGLLTLAWYEPTKLAATFVEAYLVALAAQRLVATPLLKRFLIEGPRRTVMVFCVGYAFKWIEGWIALWAFPGLQITEFFGFGYVLPSLLAVKVWTKTNPGRVLMPALQVSLLGFFVGNTVGYAMTILVPMDVDTGAESKAIFSRQESVTAELTLHSMWSDSDLASLEEKGSRALLTFAAGARGRDRGPDYGLQAVAAARLRVFSVDRQRGSDWWVVRRAADGSTGNHLPGLAVSPANHAKGIVVARVTNDGRGVAPAVRVAERVDAALVLTVPLDASDRDVRAWEQAVVKAVEEHIVARVEMTALGDATVRAEDASYGAIVRGVFEAKSDGDIALTSDEVDADTVAAFSLDGITQLEGDAWQHAIATLAVRADPLRDRDADDARAFSRIVVAAAEDWRGGRDLPVYAQAVAASMGLRFATVTVDGEERLLLESKPGAATELLWMMGRTPGALALSSPGADVRGMPEALRYVQTSVRARDVVFASERARPLSSTSLFVAVHRHLMAAGSRVLVVRKQPPSRRPIKEAVILTTGDVIVGGLGAPAWAADLVPAWTGLGVGPRWYDGAAELWVVRGMPDSVLSIGHAAGARNAVIAWISPELLVSFRTTEVDAKTEVLYAAAGFAPESGSIATELTQGAWAQHPVCEWDDFVAAMQRFEKTDNFIALRALRESKCAPRVIRDGRTGHVYWVGTDVGGARAMRPDGDGSTMEAHSEAELVQAALRGVGTIQWKPPE